jgi:hypothetical protein
VGFLASNFLKDVRSAFAYFRGAYEIHPSGARQFIAKFLHLLWKYEMFQIVVYETFRVTEPGKEFVRTLLLISKIHSSQPFKRLRQILAMLNPLHIIFLSMVREKELLEGGVNLLIGQAAVVI